MVHIMYVVYCFATMIVCFLEKLGVWSLKWSIFTNINRFELLWALLLLIDLAFFPELPGQIA